MCIVGYTYTFSKCLWMFTRKKITKTNVSFSLVYWRHQRIILRQTNARTIQSLSLVSLLELATRVEGLMSTHGIHKTFQQIVRRSTERVEKLCHMVVSVCIRPKRGTCLCSFRALCVRIPDWLTVYLSVLNRVRVRFCVRVKQCPCPCSCPGRRLCLTMFTFMCERLLEMFA